MYLKFLNAILYTFNSFRHLFCLSLHTLASFRFFSHSNKALRVVVIITGSTATFIDGALTFPYRWDRQLHGIIQLPFVPVKSSSLWWYSLIFVLYAGLNDPITSFRPCLNYYIAKLIQIGHFQVTIDLCFLQFQTFK